MNSDNTSGSLRRPGAPIVARDIESRFRLLVEGVKDYAIFMLDPDGYIVSWNEGAQHIKGYTAAEAVGRHFSMFYPRERIEEGWPEHELRVARASGRFEEEGWRLRKDGSRFWANVVITALYADDGDLLGFSKITRDLTERKEQEEALRQSEDRFRLLVERVKDYAIFMLDPDGYIVSWNEGAERIKGYTAAEAVGRHFSMFYPQERIEEGWPEHELRVVRREGRFEDEGWRLRKDGSRFWANVVITALYDREGRLRGYTKVTRDMTERKRMEALELAERHTTEFLAMLSHELRNPLSAVRNAIYMMQLKELEDPDLRWVRDILDRQVSHLTRLVDDLLEVSRVTSGSIRLQREQADIRTILSRAIESSSPLIEARRHTLEAPLLDEPIFVDGDITRLTQVFVNILTNAAKYTPEGGVIALGVALEEGGENVVVRVRDNGAGISGELLPKIFDLFTQGERTLDRADGGLGIGLTLAHRIIGMHGGAIDALSEGAGRGSEFVVRLPVLSPRPTTADAAGMSNATPPAAAGRLRVLVVDDNVDAALSMKLYLKAWGYDVRTAYDSRVVLGIVEEYRPDIILLDIGLPGMSGYEVATAIRELPYGDRIRIAAVTGYGQDRDRYRTGTAGIDHHLVKPVDPEALRSLLGTMERR